MKCPACDSNLKEVSESGINLDYCKDSCGGIWFDKNELDSFDDTDENISLSLLFAGRNKNATTVDRSKKRNCPKCHEALNPHHYFATNFQLDIDECLKCGGIWVDAGELKAIRTLKEKKEGRDSTVREFFEKNEGASEGKLKAIFSLIFK